MTSIEIQKALIAAGYALAADGIWGSKSIAALKDFQRKQNLVADGIAGPRTIAALNGLKPQWALTQQAIVAAAKRLDIPVAVMQAVSEVESNGVGFLSNGRPKILFERHVFFRQLAAYGYDSVHVSRQHPSIASSIPGGYIGGEKEHERLATAKGIDQTAAIESASWGRYQIMGFHWKRLGYPDINAFEKAMCASEEHHLEAFTAFICSDKGMHSALKAKNWARFAELYNGVNYKKNAYDIKLAAACAYHSEVLA